MNNPQKISPTFYLTVEEIEIDGKTILYIFVPESSQVHGCNGRIFDRNEDGDILIESYERLMAFVSKHLNDNFYLEGDRRVSLRDKIFREVVSNLLIHREFASPFPENFSPFPKNPTIAKFFKEIGWVDELGSGVRNITKYNKIYSDSEPTFIEGDIFKTIIPLISKGTEQATDEINKLLDFCKVPRTRNEMQEFLKLHHREHFRIKILNPLIKGGLLRLTIPDKPTSPKQKYYSNR